MGDYFIQLKIKLDENKGFRDWALKRLLIVRSQSQDFNTVSICNLLLNYIYDLNFKEIMEQNKKNNKMGGF